MEDYITPLEDDLNLFEADDIIQEAPDDDDANANDNADNAADANNDNANDDQGNDDNADNANNQDDNKNDQENDDNFDVDVNDGDDNNNDNVGDEGDADTGGDDAGGGADNTEEGEPEESDEEKDLNARIDQIYNQLTPAEKQQRDVQLRKQYKELYQAIDILINNTEEFPITSDSSKLIRRLIRNLRDFKEYLLHYFTNTYSLKSHLENLTRYRQFVQIYSGIESIYSDLEKAFAKDYDRFGRNVDELNKQNSIDNN